MLFLINDTKLNKKNIYRVWIHYEKYLAIDNFCIYDRSTLENNEYELFIEIVNFLKKNEHEFFELTIAEINKKNKKENFYPLIFIMTNRLLNFKKKSYNIFLNLNIDEFSIFYIIYIFSVKNLFNYNVYKYIRAEYLDNLTKNSTYNISGNQLNQILNLNFKFFMSHLLPFCDKIWSRDEIIFNKINLKILKKHVDDKTFRLKIFNKFFIFNFNFFKIFLNLYGVGTIQKINENFNKKRTTPYIFYMDVNNKIAQIFYQNNQNYFFLRIIFFSNINNHLISNQLNSIKSNTKNLSNQNQIKSINKKLNDVEFCVDKNYWRIINNLNNPMWVKNKNFFKFTPKIYIFFKTKILYGVYNLIKKNKIAYEKEMRSLNETNLENFSKKNFLEKSLKENNILIQKLICQKIFKKYIKGVDENFFLKEIFFFLFHYKLFFKSNNQNNLIIECNKLYNHYIFAKQINKITQTILKHNTTIRIPIFFDFRLRIYPLYPIYSYSSHYLIKNLLNLNTTANINLFKLWKKYFFEWSRIQYTPLFIKYFNEGEALSLKKIFNLLAPNITNYEVLNFNPVMYYSNFNKNTQLSEGFNYFVFYCELFWLTTSINKYFIKNNGFTYDNTFSVFLNLLEKNEEYIDLIKNKFKNLNNFYHTSCLNLGRDAYTWIKLNLELIFKIENYSKISSAFIYLDSGANVFVQLAGVLKITGEDLKKFNVIQNNFYFDLYAYLCDLLKKTLTKLIEDIEVTPPITTEQLDELNSFIKNINIYITRTIFKKIFMTFFYGSTTFNWINQLSSEYKKFDHWKNLSHETKILIYKLLTKSIKIVVLDLYKEDIFKIIKAATNNFNVTNWYLGGDYHITNYYYEKKNVRIRVKNDENVIMFNHQIDGSKFDGQKIKKSTLVNLIHSVDGLIAKSVIIKCEYPVLPIHDCFGTPPSLLEFLKYDYNKCYYEAHLNNNLNSIFNTGVVLVNNIDTRNLWWVNNKELFLKNDYNLL